MKHALVILSLVSSLLLCCFAQERPRYWYEDNAVRVDILDAKITDGFASFTLRFSNLGPDPIYISQRVGTSFPASVRVEELINGRWNVMSTTGDVRARCSAALPQGYSVTQPISIPRKTLSNDDSTIRVGLIAYHTLVDCKRAEGGRLVYSFAKTAKRNGE